MEASTGFTIDTKLLKKLTLKGEMKNPELPDPQIAFQGEGTNFEDYEAGNVYY